MLWPLPTPVLDKSFWLALEKNNIFIGPAPQKIKLAHICVFQVASLHKGD